jgi:hypothetical protein
MNFFHKFGALNLLFNYLEKRKAYKNALDIKFITRNYWEFGICAPSSILKTREYIFSCYLPSTRPGLRYLYSYSYTDMGCPVIEVSSF